MSFSYVSNACGVNTLDSTKFGVVDVVLAMRHQNVVASDGSGGVEPAERHAESPNLFAGSSVDRIDSAIAVAADQLTFATDDRNDRSRVVGIFGFATRSRNSL